MRYYIDTEFDGHNGPLLSFAIVNDAGFGMHIRTTAEAHDPWVIENVVSKMDEHDADMQALVAVNEVGYSLRYYIGNDQSPTIIADSPVDIARFCQAISTDKDGGWASADYPRMTFEVHNVDCYPTTLEGAVQHNAWWDAMALRALLQATPA